MDNVLKPPSKQELQAKIQAEEEEIERLRLRLNELFDNGAGAIFDQISRLSRDIRLLGRPGSHEEKELYKKQAKLMENPLYVEARNCMRQRGTAQSRRFEYMKALNILKAREAPYISPLSKSLPAASTTLPGNSTTESKFYPPSLC